MSYKSTGFPVLHVAFDKSLIFVSLFFSVGLNKVDKFGIEGFDGFNETIYLRIIWFGFFALMLLAVFTLRVAQNRVCRGLGFFCAYQAFVLCGACLNISDLRGIYFYAELSSIGLLWLLLVNSRVKVAEIVDTIQFSMVVNYIILVTVICFFLALKPELVYQLETQNRLRLGGDVISPNSLSVISAVFLLSAKSLLDRKKIITSTYLFFVLLSSVVVVFSGSRTGLSLYALAIVFTFIQLTKERFVISLVVGVLALLLIFLSPLSQYIGKGDDPLEEVHTLNNRTVVFAVAYKGIIENWKFGVGYVVGVKNFYLENFTQNFWVPPHSHNAYLEVLLAFGIPTGGLMLYLLFRLFWWCMKINGVYNVISKQVLVILLYGLMAAPFGNKLWPGFILLFLFAGVCYKYKAELRGNFKSSAIPHL